ncbi:hypothetical protein VTK73DRAFT_2747 [Phialemonium thermophilum]|uniref:RNA 3'-terminal phosphate cyclase domain-containing protein n=1 Tax=Phialemonium thermophilum TaxID=223376 RepID=A0ABR3Y1W1_9PEZI
MKTPKTIELDGRTGEGGGQLVRIAVALAAVITQPIRITHVRGNRAGTRGGGLKAQHVASISWLAKATDAEVSGLEVGSQTLEFRPRLRPSELATRRVSIEADTPAASTLLILQAILPFLLFAGGTHRAACKLEGGHDSSSESEPVPIEVSISGGTNVHWSLSWEYMDQVLLPILERCFGIEKVERQLVVRGWSLGSPQKRGNIWLRIRPVRLGETLRMRGTTEGGNDKVNSSGAGRSPERKGDGSPKLDGVDVSMVAPKQMHTDLQEAIVSSLDELFPGIEVVFKVVEDSGHDARLYVLLVARSGTWRWGRDILTSIPQKSKCKKVPGKGGREIGNLAESLAKKVSKDLHEEVTNGGVVDEFLQDQLVVFQALAAGETSFPRYADTSNDSDDCNALREMETDMRNLQVGERRRRDKTAEPFGEGSTHTTTARWVVAQLLPQAEWYDKGRICRGVGMRMGKEE